MKVAKHFAWALVPNDLPNELRGPTRGFKVRGKISYNQNTLTPTSVVSLI